MSMQGGCGEQNPRDGRGMGGFFVHLLPCQFDLPARVALNLTTYPDRSSAWKWVATGKKL
jgi:hypothetical protein